MIQKAVSLKLLLLLFLIIIIILFTYCTGYSSLESSPVGDGTMWIIYSRPQLTTNILHDMCMHENLNTKFKVANLFFSHPVGIAIVHVL